VKLLLAKKAGINGSGTDDVFTPLHIAAVTGHTEGVKMLLANKADMDASRANDSVTPLYIAARNRRTEVVKLFLANKVNISARAHNGKKPVDIAREKHHSDIVQLLK